MRRKKVYIAGPFKGASAWEIENNVRKAEAIMLAVNAAGGAALAPHLQGRYMYGTLDEAAWLEVDFAWLEVAEALLVLPGSENSKGTQQEVVRAVELNIPIFYMGLDNPDPLPRLLVRWLGRP